jgi:hypothetical protein
MIHTGDLMFLYLLLHGNGIATLQAGISINTHRDSVNIKTRMTHTGDLMFLYLLLHGNGIATLQAGISINTHLQRFCHYHDPHDSYWRPHVPLPSPEWQWDSNIANKNLASRAWRLPGQFLSTSTYRDSVNIKTRMTHTGDLMFLCLLLHGNGIATLQTRI